MWYEEGLWRGVWLELWLQLWLDVWILEVLSAARIGRMFGLDDWELQ